MIAEILYEVLKDNAITYSLMEGVDRDMVYDAINGKKVTTIYYEGDTINTPGYRDIEIYVFGLSKIGNPVIRAYQLNGATDTPDNMPGWRLFRLDRIKTFNPTLQKFSKARPLYNHNGDKEMIDIFIQAKFGEPTFTTKQDMPDMIGKPEQKDVEKDKQKTGPTFIDKPEQPQPEKPQPEKPKPGFNRSDIINRIKKLLNIK